MTDSSQPRHAPEPPPQNPCPQCTSLECGPLRCRFSGAKHGQARTTPPLTVHDFRDRGDPLTKIDTDPNNWSRWEERRDWSAAR